MIATLAVIITLVFGGGVSAAAEHAVPGDILYPVKVRVNEEVRASVALRHEAKARVAASRVERRLEEIAVLAHKGELKEETRAMIEAKIALHTAEVDTQLAASTNTAKALAVRAEIEARLLAKERLIRKAHGKYAVRVHVNSTETSTTTSTTSTITMSSHAARGKMKAAANKIEEVKRFVKHAREKYGADAVVRAEAHLEAAQTAFMEGETALERGDYPEAFRLFQSAHVKAQEAKLLVEFRHKFDLDIDLGSGTTTVSTTMSASTSIDMDREQKEEQEERKDRREELKEALEDARDEWKETRQDIHNLLRAL